MSSNLNYQIDFGQIQAMNDLCRQSGEKLAEFKERLKQFDGVSTLKEAKDLSEKILPVYSEKNYFIIGGAKCVVINNDSLFRIVVETEHEFIVYNFT